MHAKEALQTNASLKNYFAQLILIATVKYQGFGDLFNRGAATQLHGQLEILAQQIQDALGALLSIDGQTPDNRPADGDGFGTQRNGF
jgi:hypothetical protein